MAHRPSCGSQRRRELRRLRRSRRGYFFVVDAFIAGVILFSAFVLLLSRSQSAPSTSQVYLTLNSFMDYCSRNQLRDISNPTIEGLIASGNITDSRKTIVEQVAEFYSCRSAPCMANAAALVDSVAQGNIPQNLGYAYIVNGTTIASRYVDTFPSTHLVASQSVVTFFMHNLTVSVGPMTTEVRLWLR